MKQFFLRSFVSPGSYSSKVKEQLITGAPSFEIRVQPVGEA